MKKLLIALLAMLVFCPVMAWAQVCIFPESDTVYLIEARTSARERVGQKDSTDSRLNNASFDLFINDTMRDIAGRGVIVRVDTIITIADSIAYTLNPDFIRINSGRNGVMIRSAAQNRWKSLQYRSLRTVTGLDKPFGTDNKRPRPAFYFVSGKRLYFDPVPTGTDTIEVHYQSAAYNVLDTTGTNNNSTVDSIWVNIPADCQELIMLGTIFKVYLSNKEDQMSMATGQMLEKAYNEKLALLNVPSEPQIKVGER